MVARMARQVLVSFGLTTALALTMAAAWGQTQPQPSQPQQSPGGDRPRPLAGSIASLSNNGFVLTTRDGRSVTVRTTSTTRIIGRQPATFADIHSGDRVRILATKGANGALTAQAVQDIPAGLQLGGPAQMHGGVRQGQGDRVMIAGVVTGNPGAGTLTIDTSTGPSTSVAVPANAQLSRMATVPASNLATGARVMVRGTTNADGTVTASTIFVAGQKSK